MYFSSVRRAFFLPAVFIRPLRIPIEILPVTMDEMETSEYRQRTQPGILVIPDVFKYTCRSNICAVVKTVLFPQKISLILTSRIPILFYPITF
jgi:hypothetical protein